ncbi:pentatricopeptide repeat-containing protein At1g06143 [Cannabis sativa]|uniref:pentatricopeptide repeat-containing protein At1g06143 n=1 Tax=Cannabis sativa TaxID=3483 RepID=UPI0029CA3CF3|nr:pentatricopeptide repeat-containing protein At1g06143 [Cannabis sativa]
MKRRSCLSLNQLFNRKPLQLQQSYSFSLSQNQNQNHGSLAEQIKKCSRLVELEHVYAYMVKTGTSQDAFLTNQFITAASSTFSRIDYAVLAFHHMDSPNANVFVYNSMIKGFVRCGYPNRALQCYINMLGAKVFPTSYTFSSLIRACTLLFALGFGEAVHAHIWRNGFDSHVFVQTAMIDFYSNLCKIKEARRVFDEMLERDSYAWTTMISAHARAGDMISARKLFETIPESNMATWNIMIDGYARLGDVLSAELMFNLMPLRDLISWTTLITCYMQNKKYREALAVFKEMMKHGVRPDGVTMATIISSCAHIGALQLGKEIHLYVMQNGFELDVYLGSALIDMYAKCGDLDKSLLVFFKLHNKNLFCWNSIIEGLASHGFAKETLIMFRKMEEENIKPNGVTFISLLSACTHAGLVDEGRLRFSSMAKDYSITPAVEHYGCMVDLLSKAGLLEEALDIIRSMKVEPNNVVWGALLGGCKLHRNMTIGQIAVNELMVLEPNNSGYYHLLVNMYAEENRWKEVSKIWTTMKGLGVEKRCPGSSWIEIQSKIHQFAASENAHLACPEVYKLLGELDGQLKLSKSVPELSFT